MFSKLTVTALWPCVQAGREVLAPLEADRRLAEAAAGLRRAQDAFEALVLGAEERADAARRSAAVSADAGRRLGDTLRGFGLFLLALSRGRPRLEPCPIYYPEGYGRALRLKGMDLADFAEVTLAKLAVEADPRIRAHVEPLAAALVACVAAAEVARSEAKARDEAFALARKERRRWGRALVAARHRVEEICFGDRAYARALFAPAVAPRRGRRAAPGVAGIAAPEAAAVAAPVVAGIAAPEVAEADGPEVAARQAPGEAEEAVRAAIFASARPARVGGWPDAADLGEGWCRARQWCRSRQRPLGRAPRLWRRAAVVCRR